MGKLCDVCGEPADGCCRVDTADGPMLGYLCDQDAEDMAAMLNEWEPFVADSAGEVTTVALIDALADSLPESPPIEEDPVAIRLGIVPAPGR